MSERPDVSDQAGPTIAEWKALASKELKGADADSLVWATPEGIDVKPLYTAEDLAAVPDEQRTNLPGFAPFVRGVRGSMYANRPWTIRQYAGFSTAEESNAFYRRNLAAGQMGLSVAFDLATHRGYDSDHPRVVGDVGKAGVAIDSVEDMKVLFDGIPLDKMSVSMTMNGAVIPVLAMFVVAGEEQGVDKALLSGTIQNDILKEFMVRNTYIYPPAPSMRIVADIIEFTARNMPRYNSISISGYHMQEAGATAEQELAFTIADGLEYVRSALDKGLDVDEFAGRLSFFFAIGMNFFMEIAKLRAARLLWHRVMSPVRPEEAAVAHAAHPLPDLGRVAHRAGSVQQRRAHRRRGHGRGARRHPEPAHQRLRRGARPAHRDQRPHRPQHPADPRRGDRHHPRGRSARRQLLHRGAHRRPGHQGVGAHRGGRGARRHDQGRRVRACPSSASRSPRPAGRPRVDRGDDVVVGVNKYVPDDVEMVDVLSIDNTKVREGQIAKLEQVRANRDDEACKAALAALTEGARGDGNLLALAIEAARARATVGEISDAMEDVFGRHRAETRTLSGVYGAAYQGDEGFAAIQSARSRPSPSRRAAGPACSS